MERIKSWTRGHPILAFYIITYAISWGLGFSYIQVLKQQRE
jgi:hypothetical protein